MNMNQPINLGNVLAEEARQRRHKEFMERIKRLRVVVWEDAAAKAPSRSDKYLVMCAEGETVYMTTRSYNVGSGWIGALPYAWAEVEPIYPADLACSSTTGRR